MSDERLLAAAATARTMAELLRRVGISVDGGNYESIRWRLQRLGALDSRFTGTPSPRSRGGPLRDDHHYDDVALRRAAAGARTKADILRALGLPAAPEHYPELNRRLASARVDVSHLDGRGWRRGTAGRRVSLEQLLGRPRVHAADLKRRLVEDGVYERRCSWCRRARWNGFAIPLELDHVNGDRSDNRLENLRLLCPNCHAQTPTYRGRNIGRGMAALGPGAAVAQ